MTELNDSGWRRTFNYFDRNKDGTVSAKEIQGALLSLGEDRSTEEIGDMLATIGVPADGELDFMLFVKLLQQNFSSLVTISRSDLKSLYASIDIDRSGYVTAAELRHFMTKMDIDMTDAEMSEMISIYDLDGNNQILVDEFENIVRSMGYTVEEDDEDDTITAAEEKKEEGGKKEESADAVPAPSGKDIDLSNLSGDVLEALKLFDVSGSGTVNSGYLTEAANWLKSTYLRTKYNPDEDPSLHWDPNREKRGLGKYVHKANHIAIIVSDVGRSTRFYSDVMGFQQLRRPNFDKHGAWFTMGNVELHLIKGKPLVPSGDDLIVGHISVEVEDIGKIPKALKELGVPFRQNVSVPKGEDGGGDGTNTSNDNSKIVRQYFFRDPDGYYLEVCNCMELTKYCLGDEKDLTGYDENVKPMTIGAAAVNINIMQKWALMGRQSVSNRKDMIDNKLKQTDGSPEQIARLIGCTAATEVDGEMLENLRVRRSIFGDICQNETDESLKDILIQSGNVVHMADEIMHLKAAYTGERVYQPPAFYEEGSEFTAPPAFTVPYEGV